MLKNKFISFLILGIITYSASFIGAISTISHKEPWYSTLNKASFSPPDWIFAPVWTILYSLLAYVGFWFHCSPNPSDGAELHVGSQLESVIRIMRRNLKPSSFRLWRKRVATQSLKHRRKFRFDRRVTRDWTTE